jgi:hypothetical protein
VSVGEWPLPLHTSGLGLGPFSTPKELYTYFYNSVHRLSFEVFFHLVPYRISNVLFSGDGGGGGGLFTGRLGSALATQPHVRVFDAPNWLHMIAQSTFFHASTRFKGPSFVRRPA